MKILFDDAAHLCHINYSLLASSFPCKPGLSNGRIGIRVMSAGFSENADNENREKSTFIRRGNVSNYHHAEHGAGDDTPHMATFNR